MWNFIRGWTGAPEKKNGVSGSIFMRVATVDLYESNNGGTECCIFAATKYMSRQGTAIVIFAMLHASLMPFLSDPGVPGVRSMGPVLSHSLTE